MKGTSMGYWPGSGIVKSEQNAFDWRGLPSALLSDKELKRSEIGKKSSARTVDPSVSGLHLKGKKVNK
jgi:hypothetical protein